MLTRLVRLVRNVAGGSARQRWRQWMAEQEKASLTEAQRLRTGNPIADVMRAPPRKGGRT